MSEFGMVSIPIIREIDRFDARHQFFDGWKGKQAFMNISSAQGYEKALKIIYQGDEQSTPIYLGLRSDGAAAL